MPKTQPKPSGFLNLTLHAHLPYVIHHGTWPHGLEWLHEAVAETYLPLLRILKGFERDRIRFRCNLSLSPTLLEQFVHPAFLGEFPKYLHRKIVSAREDEAFFLQANDHTFAETARFWQSFFTQARDDFNAFDRDLVGAFRHFNDIGLIDILTSAATHAYLPLIGTDESLRAQIRTAVSTHTRHLGRAPRGIWIPECGYRPSGEWSYPIDHFDANFDTSSDNSASAATFHRIGVEQALSESSLEFFFVDTHLVEQAQSILPAENASGDANPDSFVPHRILYQPYYVAGPETNLQPTTVFPRDPRTGMQVWSADTGYPGDDAYLDFHKKRWPGGHRYWCVTGPGIDMAQKQPYSPQAAAERVQSQASHFIHLVYETLQPGFDDSVPPILSAPFDADLFGHWWFEGIQWLDALARNLDDPARGGASGIELSSSAEYLDHYPRAGVIAMHEGSWGAGGTSDVWLNPETSWTYAQLYAAELDLRELASGSEWCSSPTGRRILQQLCRELLLLESSDWQSLITTGAAGDYAESRFMAHHDRFQKLKEIFEVWKIHPQLTPEQESCLAEIEHQDAIFPDIDPEQWVSGAKQSSIEKPAAVEAAVQPVRSKSFNKKITFTNARALR